MITPNFEMAQNRATKFLLNQRITGLAFDPRNLDLTKDHIIIDTIENYAHVTGQDVSCFMGRNIDGCYTVSYSDFNIVLYSTSLSRYTSRTLFGITHELGHIYCGHEEDGRIQEIEANFFATQVLMPEIVIYYITQKYKQQSIEPMDIVNLFGVSLQAAEKRLTTFSRKRFWNIGTIDKLLLEKYKPFIDYHYVTGCIKKSAVSSGLSIAF